MSEKTPDIFTTSDAAHIADGRAIIKRYADELPSLPGVYRMLDIDGNALYIGKAKDLKRRVMSYVNAGAFGTRLLRMISHVASMEFTTTRSEAEALMLEANLVKKLSPRYNILLKDDKSFPYIFFSADHAYPRIAKHRGPKTGKGRYFGPFVSAHAVNETIAFLQKAFLLRPCSDTIFKNRSRPCLQYQIKRCSAPCVAKISEADYAELNSQALNFLTGKSRQIQDQLVAQMQELSLKMDYEKASVLRDRIRALNVVQQQQGLAPEGIGDADIIGMARDGRHCCIQLYSIRGGRNYGNKALFPSHTAEHSDAEVIEAFIAQYYQSQLPPPQIIVSHFLAESALLEEALRLHADYKVEIIHPIRGEKRTMVDEALRNAREGLIRHLSMHKTQREVLAGVQKLFGLEDLPTRIEVYDNSHISGTEAVGAMIVAGPEGFVKSEYRKFNIKGEMRSSATQAAALNGPSPHAEIGARPPYAAMSAGDDYAMLREVLLRRFKRLQEDESLKAPDLVLIDGGAGQVSTAAKVFEELGISDICYVGIAKGPDRNAGREQFFIPGREPFQLPPDDAVLHYLQRLRDEAHRFAIGTHRNKRSKTMQTSELDAIPFIGPGRKKALLQHFGSARGVAAASMDDIANVPGISKNTARVVYGYFHGE